MGRRWIGIEQMDYIEDITKARLLKVLEGEQGGISSSVDWKGGGSFVYFELKKYNQDFLNQITHEAVQTQFYKVFKTKIKQDGNANRLGADFLIDEKGNIRRAYYAKYVGDHLPMAEIRKLIN